MLKEDTFNSLSHFSCFSNQLDGYSKHILSYIMSVPIKQPTATEKKKKNSLDDTHANHQLWLQHSHSLML